MDNLVKILKKDFDFENLNCFESITDLIKENNLEDSIEHDMISIEIDKEKYYIITIECDYCGEKFYYLADEKSADKNEIKIYYDFYEAQNYNTICQNCYDEHFHSCEQCGEIMEETEGVWCEDNYTMYCESCAEDYTFVCDECGELHSIDNRILTGDYQEICEHCIENGYYSYCDCCGEYYSEDQFHYSEADGCYYCDNCYEENTCAFDYYNTQNRDNININKTLQNYDDINAVTEYHENPIDFKKRKSNEDKGNESLFFGIELEVSTSDYQVLNRASAFVADNLYCRLEHDSSIPNYGFEIISDPMTFKKWSERKGKIEQVFEQLRNNSFVSHNARGGNCGLHIHASREALGDTEAEQEETINNIILITENFKKELQKFSRRRDFNWCHFFNDDTEENKETNIEKIKEEKGKKGRYQVINLLNRHTIELRICRGTLKTNTFFASIQLFYNIIQLAKMKNFINKSWNYLVKMNNFKELQSYVNEREIKSNAKIIETSKQEAETQKNNFKKFQSVIIFKDDILTSTELEKIQINIGKNGKFSKGERQGVKKLAYAINNYTHGFYYIAHFESNKKGLEKIEEFYKNNDNILKYITIKIEEAPLF